MSKIFYDHLIVFEEIIFKIDALDISQENKQHAKKLADEIIQHKVVTHILDLLPKVHHQEFLTRFHKAPYDLEHLKYLEEKIQRDMKMELVQLGQKIKKEILAEIKKHKHTKP